MNTTLASEACVLVVDDEEDTREALREVVEMTGCSVKLAANGADALRMLADFRPCLIILDLLMPVMTGSELIDAMRNDPALASLPIVVSTSAPSRAPAGVPVLSKPIDLPAVWDLIGKNCDCPGASPFVP